MIQATRRARMIMANRVKEIKGGGKGVETSGVGRAGKTRAADDRSWYGMSAK